VDVWPVGVLEFVIKSTVVLASAIAVLNPPFVVYLSVDPLYPLLDYLFGERVNSLIFKILRLTIFYFIYIEEINYSMTGVFIYFAAIIITFRSLNLIAFSQCKDKSGKRRRESVGRSIRRTNFESGILQFNSLTLVLNNWLNRSKISHMVFIATTAGIVFSVVANCGSKKLVGIMEMPSYLVMPMVSFIFAFILFVVIDNGCKVHMSSVVAVEYLNALALSKYQKKLLKSIRPFGCAFGPLYYTKSNRLAFFDQIPNNTVSLLVIL